MSTRQIAVPHPRTPPSARFSLEPLTSILMQLHGLLDALNDEEYARTPVGAVPGSLGGHIRHCLDHVGALLAGINNGIVDYDRRIRGTAVETSRAAAQERIDELCRELVQLEGSALPATIDVRSRITPHGGTVELGSTIEREFVFVFSHTIHHNALIAAMCRTLGVRVPEHFGYAPSTIAHLNGAACAR